MAKTQIVATNNDSRILVRSIEFGHPPFRKLSNLKLSIAERLTLIAGHNGIGKSTILGLLTNTFGLTEGPKSYFGDHFYANIEKIVYLALDEVEPSQKQLSSQPIVVSDVEGVIVRKRCAMTKRVKEKRARVVPRTVDRADNDPVGQDAKIPLPTLYLGIRRLASIGEANDRDVAVSESTMHVDDRKVMVDFMNAVILGVEVTTDVTEQSIKGANKRTSQPGYKHHDALAVSMGQDSLGSIATALASFSKLKREHDAGYRGGLLVIDELDVGFHPHAIDRLAKNLKAYAKKLNLQIIATTHSPRLIEAIHPDGAGDRRAPDTVVYLLDTTTPRIAEDQSLQAIIDDMSLREDMPVKASKPVLGVYFEDEEGKQFFDALVPAARKAALGNKYGVRIRPIGLGVGGSNLIKLPDHDPIFKDRVLIVDADTSIPERAARRKNTLKLPCPAGASGTDRSPENVIKNFIRSMITATDGHLRQALLQLSPPNPSSDKLLAAFFPDNTGQSNDRDSSKSWWTGHWEKLKRWGILNTWIAHHSVVVDHFLDEFEKAVAATSRRLK
ncbi:MULTISPECIES: AAA family ATPase [Rhodanobacter]|uniref:AAA family ATPase n=1 Tax=Rhodanobacter TaxID=75309 RepID=UPI00041A20EE|nr:MULTISPECIES: AAA family ATPase [Rhodanobacter]UJJ49645.1 AAA family ATPase [Rhodanobacter denitrificans]UJJ58160.1 AAA family ATPase [Rhodanobacter denitrificans]UJM92359.1 AAA family ATPase [Rhodanobacter denitrificans]UJM95888.1 AAA family ATPase [Rhodanobacter denitrificans]UJN21281.1 AAA family ATPase [Rhodanobacter denitrificans]